MRAVGKLPEMIFCIGIRDTNMYYKLAQLFPRLSTFRKVGLNALTICETYAFKTRENGYRFSKGTQAYRVNGKLHRENTANGSRLPAIIGIDGSQLWYRNGKRHREDGPAIIWADGTKAWYQNNMLHREDGPAVIWPSAHFANSFYLWFKHDL